MCGTIPTGIDVKRSFLTEMCNPLHSTRNQWRCSRTRNRKQNRKKKIFEYCHKKEILTNVFFNIIVNKKYFGCLIIRVVLYLPEIGTGIRHFVFLLSKMWYSVHSELHDKLLPTFSWLHQALLSTLLWHPSYLPCIPCFICTLEPRLFN